jgi:hypothetical protein
LRYWDFDQHDARGLVTAVAAIDNCATARCANAFAHSRHSHFDASAAIDGDAIFAGPVVLIVVILAVVLNAERFKPKVLLSLVEFA